jgi:capsular exopolysaccharide synthesis family protein
VFPTNGAGVWPFSQGSMLFSWTISGIRALARHRLMIWSFYPLALERRRVWRPRSAEEIGYFPNLIQILTYIGPSWTLKRDATIIARGLRGKNVVATELLGKPTNGTPLNGLAQIMSDSPAVADAYDSLLGALRLARPLVSGNSILVTSTAPGEGKTTVSLCLAITASRAGQTALLIDGDLRRSSLATAVGSADTVGLIEILLGQAEVAEAIRPIAALADTTAAGAVSFMPGGRKPPLSLAAVDWSKARTAFRSISQAYGLVLLDSPPILACNDALLFACMVDAVLLVVGTGNANLDEIRRAKEQLDATGTPIVGAVLNRFKPKVHGRSTQPYRGYYRARK